MTKTTKTFDFTALNNASLEQVATIAKDRGMRAAARAELAVRKANKAEAKAAIKAGEKLRERAAVEKAAAGGDKAAVKKMAKAQEQAEAVAVEAFETARKAEARLKKTLAREQTKAAAKAAKQEPKAEKAPKAPKAKRTPKNADSMVHSEAMIDACAGKAPKGDNIDSRCLQFLAGVSKESSEAFTNSLRRPLGEFLDWCRAERVTTFKHLDTKTLLAYRKSAKTTQSGEERATSTMRMSLARVITFLRAQGEAISADISVLRVQLTDEERAEQTAEAQAQA